MTQQTSIAPPRAPATPEQLQAQVVVLLLELRGLFKHLWTGGATEGEAFEELRDRAFGAITGYLRRAEGPFRLGFALPDVLLGGSLLRGTRTAYEAAYELGRQLEELGGSELTLGVDLTVAEFTEAVVAIAKARRDLVEFSSPTPSFILRASGDHLDADDPESPEHVAQAYAASVVAMRHLFEQLEGTSVLPPRAKRIGHGLVDLSADRLSLLVAAASTAGTDAEPAGRAVNCAIFALALLRQLTADRRLLSHVAMAALLCEVGRGPRLSEDDEGAAARTMASLMALGRLNEASVVRTVVAFETQWIESSKGPVYGGRRRTTLAARVLNVVRGYQRLVSTQPDDAAAERISALYMQCTDQIEQLLVCALAAALQAPQPAASLDAHEEPAAEEPAAEEPAAEEPAGEVEAAAPPSQRATGESPAAEEPTSSPAPTSVLEVVDSGWSVLPPSTLEPEPAPALEPVPMAAKLESTPAPAAAAQEPEPVSPPANEPKLPELDHEPAPTPSAVQAMRRVPTAQGDLATQPVPHVFLYALDQGLTGTLVFEESANGGAQHQVFLLEGAPAQAHLQLRVSRLGDVLSRLNLVSSALIEGWVEQAKAKPGPSLLLGELLLGKSVLSKEDLTRALEAQLIERLAALATLPRGTTYSFYADENLFGEEPGASELLTTSPLNALFATLRGSVDEERMMATLKRIWRIPLAFHADADREAYALTGEEEAVLERIEHGRPTIDELLADRRVSRPAAIQLVYFLAITRQLTWKGQKKGPIMPRGARPKTGFSPPLPPRIVELPDDGRVLSASQNTKPRIRVRIMTPGGSRMVESGMPTPPVMQAVRLEEHSPVVPQAADSGYDVDVSISEPEAPAPSSAPNVPLEVPHAESIIVDPGAALVALVTALRLDDEGDRAAASQALLRASKLDPDEPEYAARLCRLAPATRADASERLDTLHGLHPQHLFVTLEWARHKLESEQLQQALEGYRMVLTRDMAHAEAAHSVFEIREQRGEDR